MVHNPGTARLSALVLQVQRCPRWSLFANSSFIIKFKGIVIKLKMLPEQFRWNGLFWHCKVMLKASKESRSYKLLGVYLDECLTFKNHENGVCNKINQSIYCINRAKKILSIKAQKSLYFALIHPHLLYCISVYSCTSSTILKRITLLQKKTIRIIKKSPPLAHTQPLFLQNKILPFDKLIMQSKLIFMHAVQYGYAHETFLNSWTTNIARNPNIQLRNADDFYLPNPRVDSFKNIPLYSFGNKWNSLADEIKFQYNRTTFISK